MIKMMLAVCTIFFVGVGCFAEEFFRAVPQSAVVCTVYKTKQKTSPQSFIYTLKTTFENIKTVQVYNNSESQNDFLRKGKEVENELLLMAQKLQNAGVCNIVVNSALTSDERYSEIRY